MNTNRLQTQVLMLELNEVNFEMVQAYASQGDLPHLASLLVEHGYTETTSEPVYEHIEPWIQWVTAHTGKTLAEHGVFRLGDMVDSDQEQIWEVLEKNGVRVAAMSPMNAVNRTESAAFFIPDPWTKTHVTGGLVMRKAHQAIVQAVSDNAKGKVTTSSLFWLILFTLGNVRPTSYARLLRMLASVRRKKWRKAMLLDLLLGDAFGSQTKRQKPNFATLFLNAAAHIQHHYLFSSQVYSGDLRNPEWLVAPGDDPVLEVYKLYDTIIGKIRKAFPDARLIIATGLHQDPHPTLTYYWRLKDHEAFLSKIGIPDCAVTPLMSRDFLLEFSTTEATLEAQSVLNDCHADDGTPLFEVDNRGLSLFVMLTYPHEIKSDFGFQCGTRHFAASSNEFAFVAVKNGMHNNIGYLIDTDVTAGIDPAPAMPLAALRDMVLEAATT